jgi:glucose-1-phosphate adenylyltransferase
VSRAIIAEGCIITHANIDRVVIGIRSVIENGTTIRNSFLMGADYYQGEDPQPVEGRPPLGIGARCTIEGGIIDKNARIGDDVVITPAGKPEKCGRRQLLHSGWSRRSPERSCDPCGNFDIKR